eukprot:2955386-Prymnesium_polylepis.1
MQSRAAAALAAGRAARPPRAALPTTPTSRRHPAPGAAAERSCARSAVGLRQDSLMDYFRTSTGPRAPGGPSAPPICDFLKTVSDFFSEICVYYQHAGRHGAPSGQAG